MTTQSDLRIPRTTDIIDRALDIRASAVRLGDDQAVRQIDRLCQKLPEARVTWQLGVLHITSPSGNTYHVTRGGCDCLNARKCGKRACWHVTVFELLVDMFETEAETADMEAELPANRPLGPRLAAARSAYAYQ